MPMTRAKNNEISIKNLFIPTLNLDKVLCQRRMSMISANRGLLARNMLTHTKTIVYKTVYPQSTSILRSGEYTLLKSPLETFIYDLNFSEPAVETIDKLSRHRATWLVDEQSIPERLPFMLCNRGFETDLKATGMLGFASECRLAGPSDKITVRKINRSCSNSIETCRRIYKRTIPVSATQVDKVEEFIRKADSRFSFYLASYNGQPAGFSSLFVHRDKQQTPAAYLFCATVSPTWQRKGVATELVRARLDDALSMNIDTLVSVVKTHSPSERIMRNAGFSALANFTFFHKPQNPITDK